MVDLKKLYDTARSAVPEAQLLPGGHWKLKCTGAHFFPPKEEGKSGQWAFFWVAVEPQGDVNKNALKDLGDYDYSEDEFGAFQFFGSAKDKGAINEVIEMMTGVDVPDVPLTVLGDNGERKINLAIREAVQGGEIIGKLKVGEDRRSKEPRMEVESYLPVEG